MSSVVVYNEKGQERLLEYADTPQGSEEGQGDSVPLGRAALLPGKALSRRLDSRSTLSQAGAQPLLQLRSQFLPYLTPCKETHELRLRIGSPSSGRTPDVWEKRYTPLNTMYK